MAKNRIITLLTDFGVADGYVASMKGVMLTRAPDVTIVDLTHQIPPGDVLAGAFVLNQVFDCFPAGTVHVVVVDPGVGTDRRILACRYNGQTIVCPDNGLISMVAARYPLQALAAVRNERFFAANRVGRTFAGRDIMAPVAVSLAEGARIGDLGPVPDSFAVLDLPEPVLRDDALVGRVLYIDSFGNCISNISRELLHQHKLDLPDSVHVWLGDKNVGPLRGAFGHVDLGQPLALLDSMDLLEVAVNGGRACDVLGASVGEQVTVRPAIEA